LGRGLGRVFGRVLHPPIHVRNKPRFCTPIKPGNKPSINGGIGYDLFAGIYAGEWSGAGHQPYILRIYASEIPSEISSEIPSEKPSQIRVQIHCVSGVWGAAKLRVQ
jgi:hypothetical protein